MRTAFGIIAILCVCGAAPFASDTPPAVEGQAPQVSLPLTIERVWYRSSGKRRQADLTVTEEAFEFTAKKKVFSFPLDRIQVVSFGKMKNDVDTDWIVMSVGVTRPYDVVGFRDGQRWGYGGRTREIFDDFRRLLKDLSVAQYRISPGYQSYEDPNSECTLAIPESWSSYVESLVLVGSHSPSGTTILSAEPIRQTEITASGEIRSVDDLETLDAILAGLTPGISIERGRSGRGMGCRGFSAAARERLLAQAREDRLFGEGHEVVEAVTATSGVVDGCEAVRIRGRSRRDDGTELVLDLMAAAPRSTLYVFGLRTLDERYASDLETFDTALSTVKFSVALD